MQRGLPRVVQASRWSATAAGTGIAGDVFPGPISGTQGNPGVMVASELSLFLKAQDAQHGKELFRAFHVPD